MFIQVRFSVVHYKAKFPSIESISSMELQSRALSDEQNQLAKVANVFGNSFTPLENECGSSSPRLVVLYSSCTINYYIQYIIHTGPNSNNWPIRQWDRHLRRQSSSAIKINIRSEHMIYDLIAITEGTLFKYTQIRY